MSAMDIIILIVIVLFAIGAVILNHYSDKLGKNNLNDKEDRK